MGIKTGTKWKLDRDLGEPEDEFFGLLEEDDLLGEEPARGSKKVPLLQRIVHSLVLKGDQQEEEEVDRPTKKHHRNSHSRPRQTFPKSKVKSKSS